MMRATWIMSSRAIRSSSVSQYSMIGLAAPEQQQEHGGEHERHDPHGDGREAHAALAEPFGGAPPAEEIADQPERRDREEGENNSGGAWERGIGKAGVKTAKAETPGNSQRECSQADQRDRDGKRADVFGKRRKPGDQQRELGQQHAVAERGGVQRQDRAADQRGKDQQRQAGRLAAEQEIGGGDQRQSCANPGGKAGRAVGETARKAGLTVGGAHSAGFRAGRGAKRVMVALLLHPPSRAG